MTVSIEEIRESITAIHARLIKFRRDIHSYPELSGEEEKTSAFVAGILEDNDIELRTGVGGYGVVGVINGARPGRTIAFRADMDALPVQDKKSVEYASKVEGVMHACGHDAHTTMLLGTAIVLNSFRERLTGSVKLIFQPSEERAVTGAKFMIEEGALEDPVPSAIVALHCFPEMEVGTVGHRPGIMSASSDRFRIVVKGKSGHASRPHQCVDAVLLASLVVNAIHHIVSRRTDPLHHGVISIGTVQGGMAPNIIADHVEMEGTVRALDPAARKKIHSLIEETIKGVTEGMGGGYELEYWFGTPPVVNSKKVDAFVADSAREILGAHNVIELAEPLMGAEDFAYFAEKVPGTLVRLGTGNRDKGITSHLHNSMFDIDEDALKVGAEILSWTAVKYLSKV